MQKKLPYVSAKEFFADQTPLSTGREPQYGYMQVAAGMATSSTRLASLVRNGYLEENMGIVVSVTSSGDPCFGRDAVKILFAEYPREDGTATPTKLTV